MYASVKAARRPWCALALGFWAQGVAWALMPPEVPAYDGTANRSTAGPLLTESEALALSDASYLRLLEGRAALAVSERDQVGLRPNPELELERDSASGLSDPTETTLFLAQTIDSSGRRDLNRQAAGVRLRAARLDLRSQRLERALQVRREFFSTLYVQQRRRVLAQWDGRIGSAEQVVRQRAEAGEASRYELRRLAHERALASTEQEQAAGEWMQSWETLLALVGAVDGPPYEAVTGCLLPDPPPPLEQLRGRLVERPDLQALRERQQAARLARRAGERARVPDVTLGVGAKRVEDDVADDWELVLGLGVPLPLFDRGQVTVARADAQAQVSGEEYRLSLDRAQGALRGLWLKAARFQMTAERLEETLVTEAIQLAEVASAAYEGGEVGILELLDAYRTVMETSLRALSLAFEARLAMIELDRVSGETVFLEEALP